MLEVEQLAVNYRGILGLDRVSFRVAPGELVGIVGPNGAGKSTMIKALLGLVPASHGQIHYCTCPLHQQLQKVAYVPQRSQIDWDYPISVRNVVLMARTRKLGWFRGPGAKDLALVRDTLEQVQLWDLRDRRISNLSGGQQQRVFLARALAQKAELLLFDEPFTGVDQVTEHILFEVFDHMRRAGKILLVSSHEWGNQVNRLDRLLLLNQRLIADDTPERVMTPENLRLAYGTSFHQPPSIADLIC